MGAGASSINLQVSPAAAPLVQHVATVLSSRPPAGHGKADHQQAVHSALLTAQVPDLKRFCVDRGADTGSCLERQDLIALALPLLVEMGTMAAKQPHQPPHQATSAAAARRAAASATRPSAGRRAQAPSSGVVGRPCKLCGEPIQPGQSAMRFAVPAASSAATPRQQRQQQQRGSQQQEAICHAACMRCSEDGCGATEKLRLGEDSQIYCTAHYDLRFAPRCAQCENPIRGAYVTAMKGRKYHPHCFVCAGCGQSLSDGGKGGGSGSYAIGDDGLPYCRRDFKRLFAPRCAVCTTPMTSWVQTDQPGSAGGERIKLCRRCATEAPCCFSCRAVQTISQGQGQAQDSSSSSGGDTGPFSDLPDGRTVCSTCTSTGISNPQVAAELLTAVRRFFNKRCGFKSLKVGADSHSHAASASAPSSSSSSPSAFDEIKLELCDRPSLTALCRESGSFHFDRCPLGCTINSVQMQQWQHTSAGEVATPRSGLSLPPIAPSGSARHTTREHVPQRAAVKVTTTTTTTQSDATQRGEQTTLSKTYEVRGIAALVGLPRLQLGAVLAHELCHAFMHLLRFPRLPPVVAEGVCELWASLWLAAVADGTEEQGQGAAEASARLLQLRRNADPVYGDGLRQATACYEDFVQSRGVTGGGGAAAELLPEFMKLVREKRRWWKKAGPPS